MDRRTTLYRFYDADDRLLYIGITSAGPNRWVEHEQHRAWWDQVARASAEHFATREEAAQAESTAIRAEQPPHNTIHRLERDPKPPRTYRPHGSGSVVYVADKDRWIAFTPRERRSFVFRTEDQAESFLEAAIAVQDPDVRRSIGRYIGDGRSF